MPGLKVLLRRVLAGLSVDWAKPLIYILSYIMADCVKCECELWISIVNKEMFFNPRL